MQIGGEIYLYFIDKIVDFLGRILSPLRLPILNTATEVAPSKSTKPTFVG